MARDNIEFTESLIKSQIAQTIFERIFIEMDSSIVIPLGYEHTANLLHQFQNGMDEGDRQDLISIRNMPDFLLVSQDNRNAILIKVKYRKNIDQNSIKKIATELYNHWHSVWLFLVTPEGFFFGKATNVKTIGEILPLPINYISAERQKDYLYLLKKYTEDTTEGAQINLDNNLNNKKRSRRRNKKKTNNLQEIKKAPESSSTGATHPEDANLQDSPLRPQPNEDGNV